MSSFKIPKDVKNLESKDTIKNSVCILKLLKGKTHFEIYRILRTVKTLNEFNTVL